MKTTDFAATRRAFLRRAVLSSTGLWLAAGFKSWAKISPNEKLNLGVIGVAGRGGDNLRGVSRENIVALCDVDEPRLGAAAKAYPAAKLYHDFRRLLERDDLDAVVVSTPDHTHAVAALGAIRTGRHVYCEKPLTRTVSEARRVTEAAREKNLVTQIGTQIHAQNNYRRVVELIQRGAVGAVGEVHVWCSARHGGKDLSKETPPVPSGLHYDLWLGPVPELPYKPDYVPATWRSWWAFGGGTLADFGCHYMDLPFWALGLQYPLSIEPLDGPPVHPDSTPPWLVVRYEFPARGDQPPVTLTWHHGGRQPELLPEPLRARWGSGVLFVGPKGMVLADYDRNLLLPEKDFAGFVRPTPSIPNSIGHHQEWIQAIKNGGQTTCHFDYSGPLTETALLGNVAFRAGKKLVWDWRTLQATNCPEAQQYIQHHYRPGWSL